MVRGAPALLPARYRPSMPEQKMLKLAALLQQNDSDAVYSSLVSLWPEPNRLVRCAVERPGVTEDADLTRRFADPVERVMERDALTYLLDDLLTKVDRASMSVALEVRVPLLNHRVVEAAWHLRAARRLVTRPATPLGERSAVVGDTPSRRLARTGAD
jgi:asparagine synthase (glutamine-hydrolysing)